MHRKKVAQNGFVMLTFQEALKADARVGATFIKFCIEMAYFWQGPPWQKLRSGQWLTASRARAKRLPQLRNNPAGCGVDGAAADAGSPAPPAYPRPSCSRCMP
jgi:hypothetical protein